jgi:CubicO group peptidase (beta-lactamase class C family)
MATVLPIDDARLTKDLQDERWPAASWAMIDDIAAAGWSLERLNDAFHYAGTIATDAVMIVQGGREVASRGDIARRFNCHSIRKSFLSALMGPYVEDGTIDLSLTLDALGVDDVEGLSGKEKQATIYDLLTARSGIYHPVGYETPWMRSIKPERHSRAPGTWWCYSNWDFNALGTIFTKLTGRGIHEAFRDVIAAPLGMEDFRYDEERKDGWMVPDACSQHPAYPFQMSARDLARFGLMFLRDGRGGRGRSSRPTGWRPACCPIPMPARAAPMDICGGWRRRAPAFRGSCSRKAAIRRGAPAGISWSSSRRSTLSLFTALTPGHLIASSTSSSSASCFASFWAHAIA